jgi:hypothetical protein
MANLGDVYAGRAWQGTTISLAHEKGFDQYQVIAVTDKLTCPVCSRLDGRTFKVEKSYDKFDTYLHTQGNVDKIISLFPFPRVADVDNKSPAQIGVSGWMPPFHPKCRCEMVMLT